jgi:hypothetical protein
VGGVWPVCIYCCACRLGTRVVHECNRCAALLFGVHEPKIACSVNPSQCQCSLLGAACIVLSVHGEWFGGVGGMLMQSAGIAMQRHACGLV